MPRWVESLCREHGRVLAHRAAEALVAPTFAGDLIAAEELSLANAAVMRTHVRDRSYGR